MKSNKFITIIVAFMLAWAFISGCDTGGNGGNDQEGATNVGNNPGGGITAGAAGGAGGTTAAAVAGGTSTTGGLTGPIGTGGTGTVAGGGTTAGAGTSGAGGTSGGTSGAAAGGTSTGGATNATQLYNGENRPAKAVFRGGVNRVFFTFGFQNGANGGVRMFNPTDAIAMGLNLPATTILTRNGATGNTTSVLTRPFDIAINPANGNLYVSTGFGGGNGQGRIVRVSAINTTTGLATFDELVVGLNNPGYIFYDAVNDDLYWTEYAASGTGSAVKRMNNPDGAVATRAAATVTVTSNINFPAGIVATTSFVYVCENGPAGRFLRLPRVTTGLTLPLNVDTAPQVTNILPATGQPALNRPLEVVADGSAEGVVFTDGGFFDPTTFNPTPTNNGSLRHVRNGQTVSRQLVTNNLGMGALSAMAFASGSTEAFFADLSNASPGSTFRRTFTRTVDATSIAAAAASTTTGPLQRLDTGRTLVLDTLSVDTTGLTAFPLLIFATQGAPPNGDVFVKQ
ncbi:MAG: hypothetical protein KC910_07965 [Candidatus Eremiobacteraeota bacterium]|nr:hypothetical protein [Candidatus Eremiobacteraeota bacterium]